MLVLQAFTYITFNVYWQKSVASSIYWSFSRNYYYITSEICCHIGVFTNGLTNNNEKGEFVLDLIEVYKGPLGLLCDFLDYVSYIGYVLWTSKWYIVVRNSL